MFFHIYIPQIKYRYMDNYKSCGFRTLERITLNWILIRGINWECDNYIVAQAVGNQSL